MCCVEATRRHIVFPRVDELVFKLRFFYQRTFSPRLKKNVYDNQEYFFIGFSDASSHCIFTIRVECVLTVLKYHFSIYSTSIIIYMTFIIIYVEVRVQ